MTFASGQVWIMAISVHNSTKLSWVKTNQKLEFSTEGR